MRSTRPDRSRWLVWSLFTVLSFGLADARATVLSPEVVVLAEGPGRALKEGEDFTIPVQVFVLGDAPVQELRLRADRGLEHVSLEPVMGRAARVDGYRIERHELRGRLEPGVGSVQIRVTVDGEEWNHDVDLRGFGDVDVPDAALPAWEPVDVPTIDPGRDTRPAPAPSGAPKYDPGLARRAPRDIDVSGRVTMRLNDTGTEVGVDGASVYLFKVEGFLNDVELGAATTDSMGFFSFTAQMDGTHDIYVKVRAENDDVCNVGVNVTMDTYGRNVRRAADFSGTSYNVGTIRFDGDDMNNALNIVTMLTRAHRWYGDRGFTVPRVDLIWPEDGTGSSYYWNVLGYERISLRGITRWDANTIVHEYGHHFVGQSAVQDVYPPDYFNGMCDPGHCGTCPENEAVAWSEGFPYFLAQIINQDLQSRYGWNPPGTDTYELIDDCSQTGLPTQDPESTEFYVAAFLLDLVDAGADRGALNDVNFRPERAQIDLMDIFDVAIASGASNSYNFVDAMLAHAATNYDEATRQEVWAAALVNRLELDVVPPSTPSGLDSPTHPLLGPGSSSRPDIVIGPATDAQSGVAGYLVSIDPTAGRPGAAAVFVTSLEYTWHYSLGNGTYYVNAVAVDRAGNESHTPASRRIEIGTPLPIDLGVYQPGLWEDYFLVRNDASVTAAAGAIDTQLPAGDDVWVSLSTKNLTTTTSPIEPFSNRIYLNGSLLTGSLFDDTLMSADERYQTVSAGPFQLPGGRHHFGILLDQEQRNHESDEDNNFVDRYVVVRPDALTPGFWTPFPAPPRAHTEVGDTPSVYPNVSGHRVTPVNAFAGVQMSTADPRTDYSLWAYTPATDYDSGFDFMLGRSADDTGEIETIIVNEASLPYTAFDFGVEREEVGSLPNYTIRHVSSRVATPGDDVTVNWTDQDALELVEFFFDVTQTGTFMVRVDASFDPGDLYDDLELFWMGPGDPVLVPVASEPVATIEGDESVTLSLNAPTTGRYCLVLNRPMPITPGAPRTAGTALARTSPQSVQIEISTDANGLPDLTIFRENEFFDLPFLPSFEPVQGPKVGLPPVLTGLDPTTYLNFAIGNLGPTAVDEVLYRVSLDGLQGSQLLYSEITGNVQIPGGGDYAFYGGDGIAVPGGRHTLVLELDPTNLINEFDESNNLFAVQAGWEGPPLMPQQVIQSDGPPADPTGGIDLVQVFTAPIGPGGEDPVDVPLNAWHVNCDGYRIPALARANDGQWMAVATMPGPDSDVDVRLHDVMPPIDAYGAARVTSTSEAGASDFVLVDLARGASGPWDASVVNEGGFEPYAITQVRSIPLGALEGESTQFGQFGMDGPGFLTLYDLQLEAGSYVIKLSPQSNDADLGLSVFPPTGELEDPFHSKDDGADRFPMAYDAPAGQPDQVAFEVPWGAEGVYCLAVWKVGAADQPANQDYVIDVEWQGATPPCLATDGVAEEAYGPVRAVQEVQTGFGDSDLGLVDRANGSELDQLFARVCDGVLHVTLTGNLETNYNDLELFLDTRPGGQNRLRDDNGSFGPDAALNRLGGTSNGFTFEPGFEPDWWFGVQGGDGEFVSGVPLALYASTAELLTGGGGASHALGFTTAAGSGLLTGLPADNPHGVRVAFDNSNVGGVDAGTGSASGVGVLTGVEWSIPLAAIGNPTDCVRLVAFVNGRRNDFVSNQFLPPLPAGTDNLGEPRDVDLGAIPGRQYAIVCQGTSTGIDDETPVVTRDVALRHPSPNPFNPSTRIAFSVPAATRVDLAIYDVAGRRVRTLVDGETLGAGEHERTWNGRDDGGRGVASGSYLLRLTANGQQSVRRLVLLK